MSPIFCIWINPLKTFDLLSQRNAEQHNYINILFFLTSMPAGFSSAHDIHKLLAGNYYVALILALTLSGLFGLILLSTLSTYIILGMSKLFGGQANTQQIKLTLAYALIPSLIHLIIGLFMIVPALILNDIELIAYQSPITIFIVWIFTLRILLYGLAFFNKYSYGYALLTIIIPTLILEGILYLT